MVVVGWVIWAVAFLFSLSLLWGIRKEAKNGKLIHIVMLLDTVFVLLSVILFAFLPWSKLHLLWVVPASVICAFIVGFIIVPIPIIGDIFHDLSLVFARLLLLGTHWKIGGYPWEISTLRIIKRRIGLQHKNEQCRTVEELDAAIKRHENQLFGIRLFCEETKMLHGQDEEVMARTDQAFSGIAERAEKAISHARKVMQDIKSGSQASDAIGTCRFPPIHGPGLEEMTVRATLLVRAYEKLFPGRPREVPLSEADHWLLMEEAMKEFEPEEDA